MHVNGRVIIVAILGVSLAMAGGAWWFRYGESRQAAKFWGPDAALLIGRSKLTLLDLASPDGQTNRGDLVAGRAVTAERDLSEKPGLIHFRHALSQDANFQWDQRRQEPIGDSARWPYALRFVEGDRELVAVVGPGFESIGKVDTVASQIDVLPCPRLGPVMTEYLQKVETPLAESGPR